MKARTTGIFFGLIAICALMSLTGCATNNDKSTENTPNHSENVDMSPLEVVDAVFQAVGTQNQEALKDLIREDYIQHSAFVADGRQGFLDALETLASLQIERHRALVDGKMVALHQTYTFPDGRKMVAFDIFRVENQQLAEHWDALQADVPAEQTASGRSMVDGPTEPTDLDKTEENRALAREFVEVILSKGELDRVTDFISAETYHQHNPLAADGLEGFGALVNGLAEQGLTFYYTNTPLVVAQGDFVLLASEGVFGPVDTPPYGVFYDLFRVKDGKLVEHWDVVPAGLDASKLPHDNGFF